MSVVGNIEISTSRASRVYRLFSPIALRGGEPTWNVIDRVRRPPISTWNGRSLYTLEFQLVLDGWSTKEPQDGRLLWLRGLLAAGRDDGKSTARSLSIDGVGLMAVPNKDVRDMEWVAVSLDVDAASIIRSEAGRLLRCVVTMTLQEYVDIPSVEVTTTLTKAAREQRVLRVMVRKNDTYLKIGSRRGIPRKYRRKVMRFFRRHPQTNTIAKLRSRAGKIYSIPV